MVGRSTRASRNRAVSPRSRYTGLAGFILILLARRISFHGMSARCWNNAFWPIRSEITLKKVQNSSSRRSFVRNSTHPRRWPLWERRRQCAKFGHWGEGLMARLGKGKWAEGIAVEVPRVIIALEGHYHLQ
jgi:hypothetical protein